MVNHEETIKIQETIQENNIKRAEKWKMVDKIVRAFFLAITCICSSIIIVVTVFIAFKGLLPFFKIYNENGQSGHINYLFFFSGLRFNNGYDPVTGTYLYGVMYLAFNTIYLNVVAAIISIPTAVLTSLFIARTAPKALSKCIQTGVDLLASIPSVIYGIFGVGIIVPAIKTIARSIGFSSASGISLLSGAIILALMSLPTMISVSVTALKSVDKSLINGSFALGASKAQTDFKICLKAAKSGIFAGIILGLGRALGEATAISMVCGSPTYGITLNPFEPIMTLTSQMMLSIGEAVPNSLNYDVRFSAGIVLMLIIIITNLILNDIKNHIDDKDNHPLAIVRLANFLTDISRRIGHGIKAKLKRD